MSSNPLDVIRDADLSLSEQVTNARELAFQEGALSKKHKILIALAIDAAEHSEGGVRSLALQALAAGATKAEIMETLRIAYHICGVGCIYAAARGLQGVFE
jgi:alkylhydroperoxidase/carboxymuconolactone decarboxylase family protein YurZ